MKELGQYDTSLQMFVEKPRPVNSSKLLFQRYLAETGHFDHAPMSAPVGELALAMVVTEGKPIEQIMRERIYRKDAGTPS